MNDEMGSEGAGKVHSWSHVLQSLAPSSPAVHHSSFIIHNSDFIIALSAQPHYPPRIAAAAAPAIRRPPSPREDGAIVGAPRSPAVASARRRRDYLPDVPPTGSRAHPPASLVPWRG